jgi:septal ring factor EnvC (AmiA/AmiB activator)
VALKRRTIGELERKIRGIRTEMENLKERLVEIKRSLSDLEIQVAKRLVPLYKYARKGYIKMLVTAADLDDFGRRVKYLTAIIRQDGEALTRIAHEKQRYDGLFRKLNGRLASKAISQKEEALRLTSLRKDLETRVVHLMKVHKEKEFYETLVKELQAASKGLKDTINHIEKGDAGREKTTRSFKDAKGRLPVPLKGKVIRGSKLLASRDIKAHKGIFIECSVRDSEVTAVFPGRVDFSGRLKGYGEVIIINHGSRFFTISAHLRERKTEKGERVEAGDVIGVVGGKGPSKGLGLYFEIRKAGKNLNPLRWLKIS